MKQQNTLPLGLHASHVCEVIMHSRLGIRSLWSAAPYSEQNEVASMFQYLT